MSVFQKHADSLRAVQAQHGSDCPAMVYKGKTIKILPGGVRTRKDNSPGGYSIDSDIQLTCLLADFGDTHPVSRASLTYLDQSLRITNVTIAAGGLQVRINADYAAQKI